MNPDTANTHKADRRVVLLEGIHASAVEALQREGYTDIVTHAQALSGQALLDAVADAHLLGIRSRTPLSSDVLHHARHLMAVGCYCIGTNQVDLEAAMRLGIPVFNAPFSNTRSVAELVLAELIMLMRGIPQKMPCCTGAAGPSPRRMPMRSAARHWASWAMDTSAHKWVCWPSTWA
jgi:phosphoglycerate dehydrogenase-like enzyme